MVSDDEGDVTDNNAVTLRKLELQERAKEREAEVKLNELQLREKELEMQLRLRELELSRETVSSDTPVEATVKSPTFDVSRPIKFVPSFSETEVDKYFSHFEKVAQGLKWPKVRCMDIAFTEWSCGKGPCCVLCFVSRREWTI